MTTRTDEKSLSVKANNQEQPSQGKDMLRSSPRTDFLERRREYPFGLTPLDFFRGNPFSILRRMTEEMDRVFQEVGLEREGNNVAGWLPAIEVSQDGNKYKVHAELPGLEPKDVKVEVDNDMLVIQGERRFEHQEKNGGVQRTERQYGVFHRSIPLPEGAKVDQAQAKFNNGVLEIEIPVPEQQTNRRTIPIEGESAPSKPAKSQAA
jgi:HSP20 family protein